MLKPKTQSNKSSTTTKEPEKKKGKGTSFASFYKETTASSGKLPDGVYEFLVTDAGERESEKDGIINKTVYFELTVVNNADDSLDGKKAWLNYILLRVNEDGEEEVGPGISFHKSDMVKLGIEEDFESLEDVVKTMQDIAEQRPWVRGNCKTRNGYSNTFLDKMFEDQEDKPEVPF